jgi:hypothetical protein
MQKQSYNTGPQCKGSKNQNTQTHKLKNCSYNCNNTFKLINNFSTIIKFESLLVDCCFESIVTPKHLSQSSWSHTKNYWLPSYVDQFLLFIYLTATKEPPQHYWWEPLLGSLVFPLFSSWLLCVCFCIGKDGMKKGECFVTFLCQNMWNFMDSPQF